MPWAQTQINQADGLTSYCCHCLITFDQLRFSSASSALLIGVLPSTENLRTLHQKICFATFCYVGDTSCPCPLLQSFSPEKEHQMPSKPSECDLLGKSLRSSLLSLEVRCWHSRRGMSLNGDDQGVWPPSAGQESSTVKAHCTHDNDDDETIKGYIKRCRGRPDTACDTACAADHGVVLSAYQRQFSSVQPQNTLMGSIAHVMSSSRIIGCCFFS